MVFFISIHAVIRCFEIFEAINAKRPRINPEMTPITGPENNIISLGCFGMGIVDNISASLG
jgi:hypothetical protein